MPILDNIEKIYVFFQTNAAERLFKKQRDAQKVIKTAKKKVKKNIRDLRIGIQDTREQFKENLLNFPNLPPCSLSYQALLPSHFPYKKFLAIGLNFNVFNKNTHELELGFTVIETGNLVPRNFEDFYLRMYGKLLDPTRDNRPFTGIAIPHVKEADVPSLSDDHATGILKMAYKSGFLAPDPKDPTRKMEQLSLSQKKEMIREELIKKNLPTQDCGLHILNAYQLTPSDDEGVPLQVGSSIALAQVRSSTGAFLPSWFEDGFFNRVASKIPSTFKVISTLPILHSLSTSCDCRNIDEIRSFLKKHLGTKEKGGKHFQKFVDHPSKSFLTPEEDLNVDLIIEEVRRILTEGLTENDSLYSHIFSYTINGRKGCTFSYVANVNMTSTVKKGNIQEGDRPSRYRFYIGRSELSLKKLEYNLFIKNNPSKKLLYDLKRKKAEEAAAFRGHYRDDLCSLELEQIQRDWFPEMSKADWQKFLSNPDRIFVMKTFAQRQDQHGYLFSNSKIEIKSVFPIDLQTYTLMETYFKFLEIDQQALPISSAFGTGLRLYASEQNAPATAMEAFALSDGYL